MALKSLFPWNRKADREKTDRCIVLEQEIEQYKKLDKERREAIISLKEQVATLRTARDLKGLEADHLYDIATDLDVQASEQGALNYCLKHQMRLVYCQAQTAYAECKNSNGFARITAPIQDRILHAMELCYTLSAQGCADED